MNEQPAKRESGDSRDKGTIGQRNPEPSDKMMGSLYPQINKVMPGSVSDRKYAGRKDNCPLDDLEA